MSQSHSLITKQVLPKFVISLLFTFVGMVIGWLFIPPTISLVLGIVSVFAIIIYIIFSKRKHTEYSVVIPISLVYTFTTLFGLSLYPIIQQYVNEGAATMVLFAFLSAVLLFGSLFVYTYTTKKDFSSLGAFLFFALLALIIFSIIGMFIASSLLQVILAFAGLMIFSGYVLYDISRMKQKTFTEEDVPMAVLDLYLDFVNIFLDLLQIFDFFSGD